MGPKYVQRVLSESYVRRAVNPDSLHKKTYYIGPGLCELRGPRRRRPSQSSPSARLREYVTVVFKKRPSNRKTKARTMRQMTKVRALQGVLAVLAVLVLVGSATGCGLLSDQTKQEAKKKVKSKAQQAKQEAKKKVESKARQAKNKAKKKIEAGQE